MQLENIINRNHIKLKFKAENKSKSSKLTSALIKTKIPGHLN